MMPLLSDTLRFRDIWQQRVYEISAAACWLTGFLTMGVRDGRGTRNNSCLWSRVKLFAFRSHLVCCCCAPHDAAMKI
jgi:hypothetical protein